MQTTITPNGNLKFELAPPDLEQIEVMLERHGGNDKTFLSDMLDFFGFTPNGELYAINPQDVGALTDAPILADEVDYLDNGDTVVRGQVWWYPGYELKNFAQELAQNGSVVFQKAH